MVPCHLFVAYVIELGAAKHAKAVLGKQKRAQELQPKQQRSYQDSTWRLIAFLHSLNATLCLLVSSATVYYQIYHPLIGTICQVHAIVVWLKNCSYAFTNRDLRHAMLRPEHAATLPELYSACPYPQNITIGNLSYFWWAPTLVYQPVYPRSTRIRWLFVATRLGEVIGLSVFIWLASAQCGHSPGVAAPRQGSDGL